MKKLLARTQPEIWGSFEPINYVFEKKFIGSLSGSGPEIHKFVLKIEVISVWSLFSCCQLLKFHSCSLRKGGLLIFRLKNDASIIQKIDDATVKELCWSAFVYSFLFKRRFDFFSQLFCADLHETT